MMMRSAQAVGSRSMSARMVGCKFVSFWPRVGRYILIASRRISTSSSGMSRRSEAIRRMKRSLFSSVHSVSRSRRSKITSHDEDSFCWA